MTIESQDQLKELCIGHSESHISYKKSAFEFANEIADQHDVVSFDIFDTLIFRPFSKPTDLFFLVGEKLNYLEFEKKRIDIEEKVRKEKFVKEGHYEVTLDEIYKQVEYELGIPSAEGKRIEIETELQYCYANPYMKQVVELLEKRGKKIICISDMYLDEEALESLLMKCGYSRFKHIFVSSKYKKSKSNGLLFDVVKEQLGIDTKIIHIGDNYHSDVKQASRKGFIPYYYPNINEIGMKYRTEEMSAIIGSAYRGIINEKLHCGMKEYSELFEYGYVYGGLFVLGFCNYIHEYVKNNEINKVLFLARDGDIVKKVYDILYPDNNSEYVYWSRLAATKLASSYYKDDYFRRFLYHKSNKGIKLRSIFQSMDLQDILENSNLNPEEELTSRNIESIKQYLYDNWNIIQQHYEEERIAGKIYYANIVGEYKRICTVDVGWAGSGSITLDYMMNKEWNLACSVTGILGGTNSAHNSEINASEPMLLNGNLSAYMFSQSLNREVWKKHDLNRLHNLYFELLLCSPTDSFRGFSMEDGKIKLEFVEEKTDKEKLAEVQKGIIEFVKDYTKHFEHQQFWKISGSDAYAPFMMCTQFNEKYLKYISKSIHFMDNI